MPALPVSKNFSWDAPLKAQHKQKNFSYRSLELINPMIIKDALIWATKQLPQSASAELDAEVLLCFVLDKTCPEPFGSLCSLRAGSSRGNKGWLFAHPTDRLTLKAETKFKGLVARRGRGEPVAYLTGRKEFYGYNFKITKDTLVPRPLTEELVSQALRQIKQIKKRPLTIADVGTGSGCIIISLVKELAKTEPAAHFNFYATDVSAPALTVARANARQHGLSKIIKFRRGSLLKPLLNFARKAVSKAQRKTPDIILANLPYLTPDDVKKEPSIKKEPRLALVGDFYPELFQQAGQFNKPLLIIYEDLTGVHLKNLS